MCEYDPLRRGEGVDLSPEGASFLLPVRVALFAFLGLHTSSKWRYGE